jgi:hypothetical protein
MTEHLSDDPAGWPVDPYELLGVDRGCDEKVLRRAYSRLIRKYRPEQHPDEFQKIRDAYDLARGMLDISGISQGWDGDWQVAVERPGGLSARSVPAPGPMSERVSAIWELALQGDVEAALAALDREFGKYPESVEAAHCRYWLLKLSPALNDDVIVTWIGEYVVRHPASPAFTNRLQAELAWSPWLVRRQELAALLDSDLPSQRLAEFALARWKSLAMADEFDLIVSEVETVRSKMTLDSTNDWIRLLAATLSLFVWGPVGIRRQFDALHKQLNEFSELQLQMPHVFDEAEQLDALRDEFVRGGESYTAQAHELLKIDSRCPHDEVQDAVFLMARRVHADGPDAISKFEAMARTRPVTAGCLWQLLARFNWCRFPTVSEDDEDLLKKLVLRFMNATDWANLTYARLSVLKFCVAEGIPVNVLALLVYEHVDIPKEFREQIAQFLYNDGTLGLACEAHQVYISAQS